MTQTYLGKITSAEFGCYPDREFLIGLQLSFTFNGSMGVSDGGFHTVNLGYKDQQGISGAWLKQGKELQSLLEEAKVNYVSQLINKPVEVTLENSMYKSFRILTEVL